MVKNRQYWTKIVSKILKTEMAKQDINYIQLTKKLAEIDIEISVEDLRARFSRGTFSAMLFVQCLRAMEVTNLSLEESFFISDLMRQKRG